MARFVLRTLVACSLAALLLTCKKTEAPAPPAAAARPGAGGVPDMCTASQNQCDGFSRCAVAPLTSAAAAIPPRPCTKEDGQDFVDIYSWNISLALNWPAAVASCTADTTKDIVSVRSGDGTFVVWQTWMPGENVFVNPGTRRPAAWCNGNSLAAGAQRVFNNEAKAVAAAKRLGGAFASI